MATLEQILEEAKKLPPEEQRRLRAALNALESNGDVSVALNNGDDTWRQVKLSSLNVVGAAGFALARINDDQPFSIYGTSRVEEGVNGDSSPFKIVNGSVHLGSGGSVTNGHAQPVDQTVAGD